MKTQGNEPSWLRYATLGGGLLGTVGAAVCGFSGIAATEYQASPGEHAILLAIGGGCPYGLAIGFLVGLTLSWIRRWMRKS